MVWKNETENKNKNIERAKHSFKKRNGITIRMSARASRCNGNYIVQLTMFQKWQGCIHEIIVEMKNSPVIQQDLRSWE